MGLFNKKQSIDPVEFLVLRNELVELKERLDASEQAKASLEDRLSSLAATTMVLSSNSKNDTAEIVDKIEALENRLEGTLAVGSKVYELHQRIIDVEQGGGGVSSGGSMEPRLAALAGRIDQVAELAAAPVAPDDELASRLDELSRSAETVDLLQRQMSQINARMSAQADIADQVTALSDRIGLLQQRNVDSDGINQRLDELAAAGSTQELSERLALMGQRLAAAEVASRAEQSATRAEIAEQIAALEDRIAETTQQASKVDVFDERINALAAGSSVTPELETRLADLDRQLQEQAAAGQRIADIDTRLAQIDGQSNEVNHLREIVELRSADVAGLRELIDVRSAEIAEFRTQLERAMAARAGDDNSDDRRNDNRDVAGVPAPPQISPQFSQQLAELAERVAMTAEDARSAREQATTLAERVEQLASAPATASTMPDDIGGRLDELAERVAAADDAARQAREQAASLDQRIEGLDRSALDDQLAQLWARVDASAEQARLANEQATTLAQQIDEAGGRSGNVEQQISEIWARLVGAEEQTRSAHDHAATLERRLEETSAVSGFASVTPRANTDEIDRQLAELRERLADLDRRLADMPDRGSDIQQLQDRINELAASVPDTGGLSAQLDALSQRVATSEGTSRTALDQANALDERIQSVSTQLANQLGELSRDMDSLAARQPTSAAVVMDDEAVNTLRTGQVKLAAEQARYEISVREDLAMLAEQVRQLRGRSLPTPSKAGALPDSEPGPAEMVRRTRRSPRAEAMNDQCRWGHPPASASSSARVTSSRA